MTKSFPIGRIVSGDEAAINGARERFFLQAVDLEKVGDLSDEPYSPFATTIEHAASVTGPGTFAGRENRTLCFNPSDRDGWRINRTDQVEQLPILVSPATVWTAARNIVLRAGSPHNYLRMVEHIIALRLGLGIDNLLIETDSGDPPLFDRSSLDLVEALQGAKIVPTNAPAPYITVKEPVTIGGSRGDFVTLLPAEPGQKRLRMDVAIDFASVIGKQRIRFDVTPENFTIGAGARTNASHSQMLFVRTFGLFLAETRNLGYTRENILIHGKRRYANEPRLPLEPVWHRATLDLLAAIALLPGRFIGTAISYRAGHILDCRLMTLLLLHDLIKPAGA